MEDDELMDNGDGITLPEVSLVSLIKSLICLGCQWNETFLDQRAYL